MRVILLTIFVVIADQFTKLVVKGISIPALNLNWQGMDYGQSFNVIGDFFKITFVENPGMAFGIDVNSEFKLYLSLFSLVASLGILVYLFAARKRSFTMRFALALILGGAIGNLIDRTFYGVIFEYSPLFYGKVVDFFNVDFWDFTVFGHTYERWPIFNIADAAVTMGVIILLFFNGRIMREDEELGFGKKENEKEIENKPIEVVPEIVETPRLKIEKPNKPKTSSLPTPDEVPSMSAEDEFLMASKLGEDSTNLDSDNGKNNNRKKINIEIPDGKKKERLDTFLANSIEYATRSRVQKLIKSEFVKVNGKFEKSNYQILPGDKIDITIPISPRPENPIAEDIPLNIVYEDDYIVLINKPANMTAHPSIGHHSGTLVNALLHRYADTLNTMQDRARPGIVHRIDKDTTGLLLVAKDDNVLSQLGKLFAKHDIEREYWAICWGIFKEPKGEVIGNITRSKKDRKIFCVKPDEGKHAHTHYEVIEEFDFASLIKLKLETGRTHQIRVHMDHINHPIFGDPTYNGRKIIYGSNQPKMKSRVDNLLEVMQRQALHAKTLGFVHPITKEKVVFDSELPEDFQYVLDNLRK